MILSDESVSNNDSSSGGGPIIGGVVGGVILLLVITVVLSILIMYKRRSCRRKSSLASLKMDVTYKRNPSYVTSKDEKTDYLNTNNKDLDDVPSLPSLINKDRYINIQPVQHLELEGTMKIATDGTSLGEDGALACSTDSGDARVHWSSQPATSADDNDDVINPPQRDDVI